MTKTEFIHKATLHMFANPSYFGASYDEMIEDAENIVINLEDSGYKFEDESFETLESIKTFIASATEYLMDIRDAIVAPKQCEELSAIQEIAQTLHEKFSPVVLKGNEQED